MVNIPKNFFVTAVARENVRLISLNEILSGRPTPHENTAMETSPVISRLYYIESFHSFR